MKEKSSTIAVTALTALGLVTFASSGRAQLALATGEDAAVSEDGLHRVDASVMAATWVKPDLDLSGYERIFFMPTIVVFRNLDDAQANQFNVQTGEIYPVPEARQEQIRADFGEDFHDAVSGLDAYDLTDRVGRNVLLVRGELLDMISGVPPDLAGSRSGTLRWAWEATLLVEIRDSMSDEILARTVERQRADGPIAINEVSVLTPRLIDNWAHRLSRSVGQLAELAK